MIRICAVFLILSLISCTTQDQPRTPSLKTVAPFDQELGMMALKFCEQNYGRRIARVAMTDGYVDLRSKVGCGPDCLRGFLASGVSFVEIEVWEGYEGRSRQAGPWESSYKYFPPLPGKYRHYVADNGDPDCAPFEAVANEAYRNRIRLAKGRCIATRKVPAFSAAYEVEKAYSKDEINNDRFGSIKFVMFSAVVRNRASGEVTAENSSVNFDVTAADKDPTANHSGNVRIACPSDFPTSFLQNALAPLP